MVCLNTEYRKTPQNHKTVKE